MKNKIKTFEDACKALNISTQLPDVSMLPSNEQKAIIAHYKLTVIARALNEGWKPNWDNDDERKYYPWFNMGEAAAPGVGFSFSDCGIGGGFSRVASPLCFKTFELAEYAGQQFTELYKEYFLIQE